MTKENQSFIAYLLIAIGSLALLTRVADGALWLWLGLIAAAFLFAYRSRKQYGLLIAGSSLLGATIGVLLEAKWGLTGAFLISTGIGFFAIDRVEPKPNRWPLFVGGILSALGIGMGILESGLLSSLWFAVLLIASGIFIIARNRERSPEDQWTVYQDDDSQKQTSTGSNKTNKQSEGKNNAPAAEKSQKEAVREAPAGLDPDPDLVAKLELWRRETARAEERAAYLVLTNESLRLIAQEKPKTLKELNAIKGIGKVKLERYGKDILGLLEG